MILTKWFSRPDIALKFYGSTLLEKYFGENPADINNHTINVCIQQK
jgi:hypothetical protein